MPPSARQTTRTRRPHCRPQVVVLAGLVFMVGLAGCGAVYTNPGVKKDAVAIADVQEIELTLAQINQENAAPYSPRKLPAAFRQVTNATSRTAMAALPKAPENNAAPRRLPVAKLPPEEGETAYLIGPGDVLRVVAALAEQTSAAPQPISEGSFTVQSDGMLYLPALSGIKVGDATITAATQRFTDMLKSSQIDPNYVLEIEAYHARKIIIQGAVTRAGVQAIAVAPLFLDEAIANAGGATVEDLDYASVRLLRGENVYLIPLSMLYGRSRVKIRLLDGDSLFVDNGYSARAAQAFFEQEMDRLALASSLRTQVLQEIEAGLAISKMELDEKRDLFDRQANYEALARDFVYVTGEISSPRRMALPFDQRSYLADALFDSGGVPLETGDLAQIYILRMTDQGRRVKALRLDGSNAANLAFATLIELRPRDVIFVSAQPVTAWSRVMAQLTAKVPIGWTGSL